MVQSVFVYFDRIIHHYHSPTLFPLKIYGTPGWISRTQKTPSLLSISFFFFFFHAPRLTVWTPGTNESYWAVLSCNTVFDSLGEILLCVQSNESNWAVLFCGTVYYAVGGSNLIESVDEILRCDNSNESYWAVLSCASVYYALQGALTFESVDEILRCDHSNESYSGWAVLSCGTVYYALQGGSQPRPQVFFPTRENPGNEVGWL